MGLLRSYLEGIEALAPKVTPISYDTVTNVYRLQVGDVLYEVPNVSPHTKERIDRDINHGANNKILMLMRKLNATRVEAGPIFIIQQGRVFSGKDIKSGDIIGKAFEQKGDQSLFPTRLGEYLGYSNKPNAKLPEVKNTISHWIYLTATKDIPEGEEIMIDPASVPWLSVSH